MRWLIGLVLVLALMWGGYWFVGARAFEQAAQGWFSQMQASGKDVSYQALDVQGFPNRFDLTVTAPHLTDAASGITWDAPFVQILSLSYKPWHVIAAFANDQQITLPGEVVTVQSAKLQASVVVQPLPALPLDRTAMVGDTLRLTGSSGWTLGAETLRFATRRDETRENAHQIGLDLGNLTPDPALAALFTPALPPQIQQARLSARLELSAPLNRLVMQSRPMLTALDLEDFNLVWGDLALSASGTLRPDQQGFADGTLTLRLENWPLALDVAQAAGLIAPDQRKMWNNAASVLALQSAKKGAIDLPLAFQNGQTRIGIFTIGPAPRLR